MPSLFQECFKGSVFRSIDLISLSASCWCRKIFSLKNAVIDTTDPEEFFADDSLPKNCEPIPKGLDFPVGVAFVNQVTNCKKVQAWITERYEESYE